MARIRRTDCSRPGIVRRRRGRGFQYLDADGSPVTDPQALDRIRELGIPPAWQEVWICADPQGHLQAVGVDAAGRRQYIYHEQWREAREREKFDHMLAFARRLPHLRERVTEHLSLPGIPRERVLAASVRMLDLGFFRVGSEQYAEENRSYGLATLRKEHVKLEPPYLVFDYPAKHGKQRRQALVDDDLFEVVARLKRRRGGSEELLAYREKGAWVDVRSLEINDYIKDCLGEEFSAKDFRTWHATVLCAMALGIAETNEAREAGSASPTRPRRRAGNGSGARRSPTATRRTITRAVKETAHYLGNTPAVCRASYIDPRVLDRFRAGSTIAPAIDRLSDLREFEQRDMQLVIEAAVLDLLAGTDERTIARTAERMIDEVAS